MQSLLSSEYLASGRGTESFEFIKKVTEAKSKAEEHSHVTSELESLSGKMGSPDVSSARMREYLVRLLHCFMLGYDIDFGVIYAIMATQSGDTLLERRIGYLTCSLFIGANHKLGIMLINSLQRDLKSTNYMDNCAALNALCYLDYEEMHDNILDATQKATECPKQIVRKKNVIALLQLSKRSPSILERVEPFLKQALNDQDTSVVFASLSAWKSILSDHVEQYEDLLPSFVQIMRQIIENRRIHQSFVYHGVLAPWSQIVCLQILKIYQQRGIGQEEDLFHLVLECLTSVEHKVDAAYAIILECIKLLSTIDQALLDKWITLENDPYQGLEQFLSSGNHNMQYLGLVGLEHINQRFWKDDWSNGALIGRIIVSSIDDETLMIKALGVLDSFINSSVLHTLSGSIQKAISISHDTKITANILAPWFVDNLFKHSNVDMWFIQTIIMTLAESRKNLDDEYMQSQCLRLKKIISDEIEQKDFREHAVECFVDILKRCQSDRYSQYLVQLAFRVLGENAYLSTKYSEVDVMRELQKWICITQDEYTQICGMQAMKHCIMRSKKWLSDFEDILNDYKASPIREKQEISYDLLSLIEDSSFEKVLQKTNGLRGSSSTPIFANPNRPYTSGRFADEELDKKYPRQTLDNLMDIPKYTKGSKNQGSANVKAAYSPQPASQERQSQNSYSSKHTNHSGHGLLMKGNLAGNSARRPKESTRQDSAEKSMLSSLIALDFEEHDTVRERPEMTTERFESLWLEYKEEEMVIVDRPFQLTSVEATIRLMEHIWGLQIVEIIDREFIAIKPLSNHARPAILVHTQLAEVIQLTVRATMRREIEQFLQGLPRLS